MPKAWFIGSTLTDVIIHVDTIPNEKEELSVYPQQLQIGGCAFNASDPFRHLNGDYELLSPIGNGQFGEYVATYFKKHHIPIVLPSDDIHGCCYCFVDHDGERSFRPYRGCESIYDINKLRYFSIKNQDIIYVCGIEIIEETGDVLIQYFKENNQASLFFAPGPYMNAFVDNPKWDEMLSLHPILHLNQEEAKFITQTASYQEAAAVLHEKTQALVIITLGKNGSYAYNGINEVIVESQSIENVTDTIGCGDNHAGMCIYGLLHHWPIKKTLQKANLYSAAIVQCVGGQLTDSQFMTLLGKDFIL